MPDNNLSNRSSGSGELPAGYNAKTGLPAGAPNAGATHRCNVGTTATGAGTPGSAEGNSSQTGLGGGTGPNKASLPAGGTGGNSSAAKPNSGIPRYPEGNLPATQPSKPFKLS